MAPTPTPTVQDVVGRFDASLVQIEASTGWGSGFIVHADGGVVTNAHVVGYNTQVEVWMHDGQTLYGEVVGIDEYLDLAYIKLVSRRKFQASKLGDGAELGQDVFALGFPLASVTPSLTKGIISMVFTYADVEWLQIDASVNPGSSGGPLLDRAGRVVGIITSRSDSDPDTGRSVEGIGFALSVVALKERLDFLAAGGMTLMPTQTPTPTPTPAPAQAQEELGGLATTELANLWIYFDQDPEVLTGLGLRVMVYPSFEAEAYMLTVHVDEVEYCNPGSLEIGEMNLMGCTFVRWSHSWVRDVSAEVFLGDRLVCARHTVSTADQSAFACVWEGGPRE